MKFYTLTYNCNTPTDQQINVPTNTDYKVGIKVVRNGKEQNLKPAEVTIGALSADEGDINGYMTFSSSTGDDAYMTRDTIDIQHAQNSAFEKNTIHNDTGSTINAAYPMENYSLSALTGKTMTPDTFRIVVKTNQAQVPSDSEIAALTEPYSTTEMAGLNLKPILSGDQGTIWCFTGATRKMQYEYFVEVGVWKAEDGIPFFFVPTGTDTYKPIKEYTFDGSEKVSFGKFRLTSGNYAFAATYFTFDEPFDAQFKLTTNVYKSQEGNLGAFTGDVNTVNFAGQKADGTDFSYNLILN